VLLAAGLAGVLDMLARFLLSPIGTPRRIPRSVAGGAGTVAAVHSFEIASTSERLAERGGGYDVVHTSPGLEIGVYVLVAPEEDRQAAHSFDEVYVVLGGEGSLDVDGHDRPVRVGDAVFVPAGTEHRFHAYEEMTLLVVFNGPHSSARDPGA
jgi:mannose-6-phosphate isomerase-like protein (cupin superfamily)